MLFSGKFISRAFENLASFRRFAAGSSKRRNAKAKAAHGDLIWAEPKQIRYKLTRKAIVALRTGENISADWDLERTNIERGSKFLSMMLHYRDGVRWIETPLFRRYLKRLNRGEIIRGCRSIAELERVYQADMDRLRESLSRRGFQSRRFFVKRRKDLPNVYLGRDGEIIFGAEGNHRLALATVLKLSEMPCRVIERHQHWSDLREKLKQQDVLSRRRSVGPGLADHPDLQSLLHPRPRFRWRRL